jgi:hypothetical protein
MNGLARVSWNSMGWLWAGTALAALVACGPKETAPQSSGAAAAKGNASAKSGETGSKVAATAAEVAAQARGKVTCPVKPAAAARAADAPVDDVVGVRPGMTYEEAAGTIMCTHDLLVVQPDAQRTVQMNTYGQNVRQGFYARFAEPKINKSGKEIVQEMQDQASARGLNKIVRDVKPGQAKWYVGTMGMPGSERVLNVAREEWFEEGRNPPVAKVDEALRGKYGVPSRIRNNPGRHEFTWIHDPEGRLIAENSAQDRLRQCSSYAGPEAAVNFSTACGIVVAAAIVPMRSNPDLAESMQVSVISMAAGYAAIMSTEKGLQQLDAQRRGKEVEKASKDSAKLKI